MNIVTVYVAVATLAVALWLPLFIKFYRAFMQRKNPISLGVAGTIMLVMWTVVAGIWAITNAIDAAVFLMTSAVASTFIAAFTHFAFYWSAKNFPNSRGITNGQ